MFGLLPKEAKFFTLFQEMGAVLITGAERLQQMLNDYSNAKADQTAIKDIEHRGDTLTHEIINTLNKTFITPFDPEDIYALASALDDVLDLIDASAQRFVMYRVEQPTDAARELAGIILKCCHTLDRALQHLGKGSEPICKECIELNALENEADKVCREAISRLFDDERDPVQLIKWKEIYEVLERTTDKCEDAANILESVVMKNA